MRTITLLLIFNLILAFSFDLKGQTVTDADGNVYDTVMIGTQVWLKSNLKTTKYNDGVPIPNVTDNVTWSNLTTPAYCWYENNKATYGDVYGALYNGYSVATGKLCPTGWHVPTNQEWTTLIDYLGGSSVAGNKLKEAGTAHWYLPNPGATNESGFTALPSGLRGGYGVFDLAKGCGTWYSSTFPAPTTAGYFDTYYHSGLVGQGSDNKMGGRAVRCIIGDVSGLDSAGASSLRFTVYPNPSEGRVNIEYAGSNQVLLRIFDMYGRLILEKWFTGSTEVELSEVGVYSVSIVDGQSIVSRNLAIN